MRYRDSAILVLYEKRLSILDARPACGWIPNMTYAHRPAQNVDLSIFEDLSDKAHTSVGADGLAIMHGYAGSLLPPMLQGIEGVVNRFSYVIARLIEGDTDNAAGIVQLCDL
jgi:hypothetical protein